jgi:hypothetical protein
MVEGRASGFCSGSAAGSRGTSGRVEALSARAGATVRDGVGEATGDAAGDAAGGAIGGAGVGEGAGVVLTLGGGASGTTGPCAVGFCDCDGGSCQVVVSCARADPPASASAANEMKNVPVRKLMVRQGLVAV